MSWTDELLFRRQNPQTLEEIAELLGGEVDGKYISCPSPGRPPDDRSCSLIINPDRPGNLYVYECDGSLGAAYRYFRSVLGSPVSTRTEDNSASVMRIWRETVPANDTSVETYLRGRRITGPIPPVLRFHRNLRHPSGIWAGMVAAVSSPDGGICAIHRTFIASSGAKAPVDPVKMTLGPIGAGAIRLSPIASKLIIAEGIETALSVMQASGIGAWSALSAVGLRTIELPPEVRQVIVAADGDDPGMRAAKFAQRRLRAEGRIVTIIQAPAGKDFNDVLKEEAER